MPFSCAVWSALATAVAIRTASVTGSCFSRAMRPRSVSPSLLYAGESEVMFVDLCHLTSRARKLLAHRIGEALLERLQD